MSERVNVPSHPATIAIRLTLARQLAWASRPEEAAHLAARALADAMAVEGRGAHFLQDVRRILFDVYWSHGNIAAARALVDEAFVAYGSSALATFERADLLLHRATLESTFGRHAEALATLRQAAAIVPPLRESLLQGNLALRGGQAHLVAGDVGAARRLFDEQRNYWRAGQPGLTRPRVELAGSLVEALLSLGEVDEARRVAIEAEAEFEREPARVHFVEAGAQVQLALGRVQMAERRPDLAMPHLERAASQYRAAHHATSPRRAGAEVVLATCLLHLDRRDEALGALQNARAAYAQHAELGEQFRAPLRAAEALARLTPAPKPPAGRSAR